jgi:hypothetical protein
MFGTKAEMMPEFMVRFTIRLVCFCAAFVVVEMVVIAEERYSR